MSTKIPTSLALLSLILSHSVLSEPLFWSATKGDRELMILGSIHMGKPEMYPLPTQIMDFLANSDALITEIDLTATQQATSAPGSDLLLTHEVLNNDQQNRLAEINQQLGYGEHRFLNLPAWQTAVTLQVAQFSQLGFQQALGIDSYITDQAKQLNKPIIGLEDIAFQLNLFTQDKHTSRILLTDTIDNWAENRRVSECLASSWQAGDPAQMEALAQASEIDEQLSAQFIYQRNHDWLEKLDATRPIEPDLLLASGKYLVVVGALHLVGKQSLITLLAERGYRVSQLSQASNSTCSWH